MKYDRRACAAREDDERQVAPSDLLTAFLVLSLLVLAPVLICALPPILDYPNHMARMHILASAPLIGDLARYYAIGWSPIPDLAADAVVPLMARLIPVEIAMRAFLGLLLIGLAGGVVVLYRVAFRRWSLWPLTAFLLLYNRMLLWGFFNYLAGLALMLWGLAAWIAIERRPTALRVAVGMLMATAIYLAHLAAFGCYALAILALSLAPPAKAERMPMSLKVSGAGRRIAVTSATLLPPIALFLLSPTSGAPLKIAYGNPLRKFDLPVSIFDNYSRLLDGGTFAVLLVAIVGGLSLGALRLHPRLKWCVAALLVAFVALPSRFLTASGIDHRLPIAIAFLFVASSDLRLAQIARQRQIAFALLAVFAARMAVVTVVWHKADQQYAALLPSFDAIAPGSALAVASPAEAHAGGLPMLHFATLAIIRRDAFAPTLFADRFQQPVQLTRYAERLAAEAQPGDLWRLLSQGVRPNLNGYDDIMIIDPPPALDRSKLPGPIIFDAPRLLLVRLTTAHAGPHP